MHHSAGTLHYSGGRKTQGYSTTQGEECAPAVVRSLQHVDRDDRNFYDDASADGLRDDLSCATERRFIHELSRRNANGERLVVYPVGRSQTPTKPADPGDLDSSVAPVDELQQTKLYLCTHD